METLLGRHRHHLPADEVLDFLETGAGRGQVFDLELQGRDMMNFLHGKAAEDRIWGAFTT